MYIILFVILYSEMLINLGRVAAFDSKNEILLKQYPQLNSTRPNIDALWP